MLDSVSALAFEMQAGKGMFALLLGSGISRAAKIPTGWDITLDLVRRVAALKGENPGVDPAEWYSQTFAKAPDYSDLLDLLATTPTLRQQVIRPYIEPNDEERGRGEKRPTAAHHAIARLMSKGYVRVILTTNFDSLLEQALAELGMTATVIASADQVSGALPLVHAGPTIVKLHGDYMDTRIRNTLGELSAYEPQIDSLLDQILDEFGLIVCGWSGEWDVALKAAIDRAPSRRFPMYWAARGTPVVAAQLLIDRRAGRIAQIDGADEFFDTLEQRVQAIETLRRPHPLSADIAVAMLKEYLPEERHQIRLRDLLNGEFRRALNRLDGLNLSTQTWSTDEFATQTIQYIGAAEPLLPLAFTAGMWSNDSQALLWSDLITELAERRRGCAGATNLVDLRVLPASLIFYAFCLGAIVGNRLPSIGKLTSKIADLGHGSDVEPLGTMLNIWAVITDGGDLFKLIPAYADKRLPSSELVADVLRPVSRNELRGDNAFDAAFARLEMALAFKYAEELNGPNKGWFWVPPGRFLLNRKLRESQLDTWQLDYAAQNLQSELCVMLGLKRPPMFDEVKSHWKLAI
jgi:hypothetical protein